MSAFAFNYTTVRDLYALIHYAECAFRIRNEFHEYEVLRLIDPDEASSDDEDIVSK